MAIHAGRRGWLQAKTAVCGDKGPLNRVLTNMSVTTHGCWLHHGITGGIAEYQIYILNIGVK